MLCPYQEQEQCETSLDQIHSVQEDGRKLKVYQELLATHRAKQKKKKS